LINKGLSNLIVKPTEDTSDLLNRITDTMVIINESYSTYQNKVTPPQHNVKVGYLDATTEKYKDDTVNNVMQFFKLQLFRAALLHELCNVVVAQKVHLG
jgi:hypothetical protein